MNKYIIYFSLKRHNYYFVGISGEIKGVRASSTKEIEKASTYSSIKEAKLDLQNYISHTVDIENYISIYNIAIETISEHMIRKIIE